MAESVGRGRGRVSWPSQLAEAESVGRVSWPSPRPRQLAETEAEAVGRVRGPPLVAPEHRHGIDEWSRGAD